MFKEIFENKKARNLIIVLVILLFIALSAVVTLAVCLTASNNDKKGLLLENNKLIKENHSMLSTITVEDKTDTSNEEETTDVEDESEKETEESTTEEATTENSSESESEQESEEETKQDTTVTPNTPSVNTSSLPFGKLSVNSNGQLVGEDGKVARLKGVSTHGITWFPEYVNADAVKYCKEQLGANLFRLSLYTAEYNGYCEGGDQNALKQIVHNGVKYATDNNMYVIIDWHVLNDNNPNKYKDQAIAFFTEMSATYKDYDNVIYEICNEPCGGVSWTEVKNYALQVIPVIRANDKDAIIIVGTPTWSQDVDIAANDRITGYDNVMYAFHFYAATHRQDLRNRVQTAINSGLPIFVSEFGITTADGNGWIDETEANTWIKFFDDNNISYCMWSLCNKNEMSAMINSWITKTSGWTYDELSQAGKWLAKTYGGAIANGH